MAEDSSSPGTRQQPADDSNAKRFGLEVQTIGSPMLVKVCRRRWLMLALYIFYASLVAGQWIEYSIISNIVARYVLTRL